MNEIALRLASRIFDKAIIENQYRSAFVEAMIEPYLLKYGWRYTGDSWSGWDFEREDGSRRLEVKQSAAHQTWSEARKIKTRGTFDIAARTGYFYESGSKYVAEAGRCAHTYVFAWHPIYGPETDHRNPDQWEFYVVPAFSLPQGQRTLALSRIKALDHKSTCCGLFCVTALAPSVHVFEPVWSGSAVSSALETSFQGRIPDRLDRPPISLLSV
jgi:hypothetical protein